MKHDVFNVILFDDREIDRNTTRGQFESKEFAFIGAANECNISVAEDNNNVLFYT